jgi:hypothetical protein
MVLSLVACGGSSSENAPLAGATVLEAPIETFVPPSTRGCSAATSYDFCFAFDSGTPLAVHVTLPRVAPAGSVAVVRVARVTPGVPARNLDEVKFKLPRASAELGLYFQVDPGAVRIALGVDADGDGVADGPGDDFGWSPIVTIENQPIATHFDANLTSR